MRSHTMAGVFVLVLAAGAQAGYLYNWNVAVGSWHSTGNWDLGFVGLPGAADDATIGNGGTANINAVVNIKGVQVHSASTLNIGADLNASGQLHIGTFGAAAHIGHTEGTVSTSLLKFGDWWGNAGGTYTLSGNARLEAGGAYIGKRSPATFTQTGGVVQVDFDTHVGWGRSSSYLLHGGSMSCANLTIANASHAAYSGSVSVYEVGAATVTADTITVNQQTYNTGIFRITNDSAVVNIAEHLRIYGGWEATADGTVNMNGADLYLWSTDAAAVAGLARTTFVFDGTVGVLEDFEAASADLGDNPLRAMDNFHFGSIVLSGAGGIRLVDYADNQGDGGGNEVLYVNRLVVGAGATLDLAGKTVYAHTQQIDPTATLADSVGGGQILFFVPGPPTAALVLPLAWAGFRRRRG